MSKKATATAATARVHTDVLTFDNILVRQPQEPASWVRDMQRHFAEHGFYRASDLDRLLGQPGESVGGSTVLDFVRNGMSPKK